MGNWGVQYRVKNRPTLVNKLWTHYVWLMAPRNMIFGIYTQKTAKKYYIPLNLHEIVINESSLEVNWKHLKVTSGKKLTTKSKNIYFLKVYWNDHLKSYRVCKFGKKKSEVFGSHTRPKTDFQKRKKNMKKIMLFETEFSDLYITLR